jgi:outer membrane protein TolC
MPYRSYRTRALAIPIGKAPAEFGLSNAPLSTHSPVFPTVPVALPAQSLERRPDIAGVDRRMAAANEQIGIAKAAYYPTLIHCRASRPRGYFVAELV